MPEAVSVFADTKNVKDVITSAYDLIPSELFKQNKRFIVTDLKNGLHFDRVESTFLWLYNAGVAIPAFNSTIPFELNDAPDSKFTK